MIDGSVQHEDSAGHKGTIGPGDLQWMIAGRGSTSFSVLLQPGMLTREIYDPQLFMLKVSFTPAT